MDNSEDVRMPNVDIQTADEQTILQNPNTQIREPDIIESGSPESWVTSQPPTPSLAPQGSIVGDHGLARQSPRPNMIQPSERDKTPRWAQPERKLIDVLNAKIESLVWHPGTRQDDLIHMNIELQKVAKDMDAIVKQIQSRSIEKDNEHTRLNQELNLVKEDNVKRVTKDREMEELLKVGADLMQSLCDRVTKGKQKQMSGIDQHHVTLKALHAQFQEEHHFAPEERIRQKNTLEMERHVTDYYRKVCGLQREMLDVAQEVVRWHRDNKSAMRDELRKDAGVQADAFESSPNNSGASSEDSILTQIITDHRRSI